MTGTSEFSSQTICYSIERQTHLRGSSVFLMPPHQTPRCRHPLRSSRELQPCLQANNTPGQYGIGVGISACTWLPSRPSLIELVMAARDGEL